MVHHFMETSLVQNGSNASIDTIPISVWANPFCAEFILSFLMDKGNADAKEHEHILHKLYENPHDDVVHFVLTHFLSEIGSRLSGAMCNPHPKMVHATIQYLEQNRELVRACINANYQMVWLYKNSISRNTNQEFFLYMSDHFPELQPSLNNKLALLGQWEDVSVEFEA